MPSESDLPHFPVHFGDMLSGSWQVLVCGAELYTSNAALMPVAFYEKKISLQQVTPLFVAVVGPSISPPPPPRKRGHDAQHIEHGLFVPGSLHTSRDAALL